jgi:hypothetical protein
MSFRYLKCRIVADSVFFFLYHCQFSHFLLTSIDISFFIPTSAFRPGNCLWNTFSNSPENLRQEPLGLPITILSKDWWKAGSSVCYLTSTGTFWVFRLLFCPRIDGRQVLQYVIWQVYIRVIRKLNNLWGNNLGGKSPSFGWNAVQHAKQGMDINQRKITG